MNIALEARVPLTRDFKAVVAPGKYAVSMETVPTGDESRTLPPFVIDPDDPSTYTGKAGGFELSVHLRSGDGWRAPVLLTQAAMDKGVDAVVAAIAKHGDYLHEHRDAARESERRTREFVEVLSAELEERAARAVADGGAPGVLSEIRAGKLNPYSAARRIIEDRKLLIDLLHNGSSKARTD